MPKGKRSRRFFEWGVYYQKHPWLPTIYLQFLREGYVLPSHFDYFRKDARKGRYPPTGHLEKCKIGRVGGKGVPFPVEL